jgi:CHRD domain-containing protein
MPVDFARLRRQEVNMSRKSLAVLVLLGSAAAFALPAGAEVQVGGTATTRLRGFDEVPALSTSGGGRFSATIDEEGTAIEWELSYFSLTGHVTQAHIHFAQRGVNGGIVVFLCSNLSNAPSGVQSCPESPGTVHGTITFENVGTGANSQGIGPFEFPALLRAIRAGITYANVHSDLFPGGEIRGQLSFTPSD